MATLHILSLVWAWSCTQPFQWKQMATLHILALVVACSMPMYTAILMEANGYITYLLNFEAKTQKQMIF